MNKSLKDKIKLLDYLIKFVGEGRIIATDKDGTINGTIEIKELFTDLGHSVWWEVKLENGLELKIIGLESVLKHIYKMGWKAIWIEVDLKRVKIRQDFDDLELQQLI